MESAVLEHGLIPSIQVMETELKKIRQNRLECGVPGFMNGMSMTMTGKPAMMMPETALKILAPNALIGRIIGKQGKKVNEIKDKSGAKITVSNVYDINAENPERTIIITGMGIFDCRCLGVGMGYQCTMVPNGVLLSQNVL